MTQETEKPNQEQETPPPEKSKQEPIVYEVLFFPKIPRYPASKKPFLTKDNINYPPEKAEP